MSEPVMIEIDFRILQAIARYYEFPSAVFCQSLERIEAMEKEKGTRLKFLYEQSEKLERIKEILTEVVEE